MNYEKDNLTGRIIECIIKVHQKLGPGFLENIYRKALIIELSNAGLKCESEKEIVVLYDNIEIGCHRLDVLVEDKVIMELKTVNEFGAAHYAQIKSYLKATGIKTGILVNFALEKADFRRIEL